MELPPTLLGTTTFVLHKVGVANRRAIAARLAGETGLSLWEFAVLATLADGGPAAQREVGARLGADPSDMVRLMDGLLREGLAGRERDPDDRRRYRVTLTPAGRERLARAREIVADTERRRLAPLSPAEQAQLHTLITKLFHHPPA
ncbi:MarR family winged helix-turn-helix transcriptional regulator [Actinomadura sp. ATCC 31491]|uniref:MarR family winged helix-turn-helix transcriptional regulator n=1 Tax=Actinomadura luzonensis TaxID=2805427 RepID=A0ABT0FUT1_9ACTN|nr:MarR family winged helix-turn-helix transcriptional regulator [Actinomadura luzonensis]MCK2216101.1 MarR family winged helix-turn-helix transcriptional regulator [Actinomadura luzonensis]